MRRICERAAAGGTAGAARRERIDRPAAARPDGQGDRRPHRAPGGSSWSGCRPRRSRSARRPWRPPAPATRSGGEDASVFRAASASPPRRRGDRGGRTSRRRSRRSCPVGAFAADLRVPAERLHRPDPRGEAGPQQAAHRPRRGPADRRRGPGQRARWSAALSACTEADNVRIVHVRDWHDPDDPRQQAELDVLRRALRDGHVGGAVRRRASSRTAATAAVRPSSMPPASTTSRTRRCWRPWRP